MGWITEIVGTGLGGAAGVLVGVLLTRRQSRRDQLLDCYTSYFSEVLEVALQAEAPSARAALFMVSKTSHRLELLESDGDCVMATGMLFAKCHMFVGALDEGEVVSSGRGARLRKELSEEYAKALGVVRRRLGFDRIPPRVGPQAPPELEPATVPQPARDG